MTAIPAKC